MKNLFIVIALCTFSISLSAQAKWEKALKTNLAKAEQTKNVEELNVVTAGIERIALSKKNEYLPAYYTAFYNLQMHWRTDGGCETCVEKANEMLTQAEAAEDNDEIMALRGYYYQAKLTLDYGKAPYYSRKANELLQGAIGRNTSNPRAYYLLGQLTYYTPEVFGGGKEKAMPLLDKAGELFKAETVSNELAPSWGQRDLDRFLSTMK